MPADFDVPQVEAGITATRFSGYVRHLASVGSTNQLALEAAQAGARGGVWVADEQTAGRGRGGHSWHSVLGDGLYVSVLVKPDVPVSEAAKIPLATGLAVRAAVWETAGLTADLRWPNDLMFAERKFGGVLVESASESGRGEEGREASLKFAVIGIGLNVNHAKFPSELSGAATSLLLQSGRTFAREPLLASLLRGLDQELRLLEGAGAGSMDGANIGRRFEGASTWVNGKRVTVDEAGGYRGTTRGLDPRGFLLVEDSAGALRTVLSGGVRSG